MLAVFANGDGVRLSLEVDRCHTGVVGEFDDVHTTLWFGEVSAGFVDDDQYIVAGYRDRGGLVVRVAQGCEVEAPLTLRVSRVGNVEESDALPRSIGVDHGFSVATDA